MSWSPHHSYFFKSFLLYWIPQKLSYITVPLKFAPKLDEYAEPAWVFAKFGTVWEKHKQIIKLAIKNELLRNPQQSRESANGQPNPQSGSEIHIFCGLEYYINIYIFKFWSCIFQIIFVFVGQQQDCPTISFTANGLMSPAKS